MLSCGLLLVVGSACSSSGNDGAAQKQPTTTVKRRTPTTKKSHPTTPTTTPVTAPAGPRLTDLILSNGPAGYVRQADDVGDTGPTNLVKATNDDNCADAREALLSAGFNAGYQRLWTSVDSTGVSLNQDYLFLYRFDTPEGAQAWVQHWQVCLLANQSAKAPIQPFTPPLIPDAVGMSAVSEKQGSTGIVLFQKGPYAVQALVVGGPGVDQSGTAADIAYAQYQQLP